MKKVLKNITLAVVIAGFFGQVFASEDNDLSFTACLNGYQVLMPFDIGDKTIPLKVSLCSQDFNENTEASIAEAAVIQLESADKLISMLPRNAQDPFFTQV